VNGPNRAFLVAMTVFAALGTLFAAVSTHDFIAHLDRQVHAITCSLVPGVGAADSSGSSGCHLALMSPYSAVARGWTWGGIPIALPALALFAFLLFRCVDLLLRRAEGEPGEMRFMLAVSALPVLASAVYFGIAVLLVGAVCKVCVGIYVSSIGLFVSAFLAHRAARGAGRTAGRAPVGLYGGEAVLFLALLTVLYVGLKPAYPASAGACGDLVHPEDKYGARIELTAGAGVPAVEVLDPLCPACRGMGQRLRSGGFDDRLALSAALFPLDKDCNWMVRESVHPGACAASEAVLCAGPATRTVLEWVFSHQSELHELGQSDPARVGARITKQFPELARCIGKPEVKARLNKSLRWVVSNSLPVLTPQLFVRGRKICDEDTDLGLEYVLDRALRSGEGRSR
jgi:uncharacterized membrane protein